MLRPTQRRASSVRWNLCPKRRTVADRSRVTNSSNTSRGSICVITSDAKHIHRPNAFCSRVSNNCEASATSLCSTPASCPKCTAGFKTAIFSLSIASSKATLAFILLSILSSASCPCCNMRMSLSAASSRPMPACSASLQAAAISILSPLSRAAASRARAIDLQASSAPLNDFSMRVAASRRPAAIHDSIASSAHLETLPSRAVFCSTLTSCRIIKA
mmetsp:Transcript_78193/g.203177  ORF Transcript_78193/g.203177 Transcript_78193/m.203177 type:complete len:217 (-) Transcript_78193:528-1178(-)